MECEMVRCQRRLDSCKYKNFTARTDLENRSAAVSPVKIFRAIKCNALGHAPSFHELPGTPFWRNAVNRAVVPARHEEISAAVQRQAAGIHDRGDERLHAIVRGN